MRMDFVTGTLANSSDLSVPKQSTRGQPFLRHKPMRDKQLHGSGIHPKKKAIVGIHPRMSQLSINTPAKQGHVLSTNLAAMEDGCSTRLPNGSSTPAVVSTSLQKPTLHMQKSTSKRLAELLTLPQRMVKLLRQKCAGHQCHHSVRKSFHTFSTTLHLSFRLGCDVDNMDMSFIGFLTNSHTWSP